MLRGKDALKNFRINLQLHAEGDGNPPGGNESDKTFTQADVDRIVGERLGREKSKYADYEDLKELVPVLQEFGYQGTPAEIKAVLRAQAEENKKQAELEALKKEAEKTGADPELLAEIKALKAELADIKKDKEASKAEVQAKKQAEEAWNQQVKDFGEKHPDIDLEKLSKNEKFTRFLERSNPRLTLAEVYEDFTEMIGKAEAEAIAKIKSNVDRTTSSGRGSGQAEGGTYGLTERQQQLAKEAGMTYKEYAELLSHIKK